MSLLLIDQPYRVDSLCQGIDPLQCHSQGLLYATGVTTSALLGEKRRTLGSPRDAARGMTSGLFFKGISSGSRAGIGT